MPFVLAALAYTQIVHLPLEQILNGAIAAVLFNIIYDTLLSRKLRWFAMCPVIDSMNHQSTSAVGPVYVSLVICICHLLGIMLCAPSLMPHLANIHHQSMSMVGPSMTA